MVQSSILSEAEIDAWRPRPRSLAEAVERWGMAGPRQLAGRFFPMACVALEVTQRCNLDCTLCYLSDRAEAVHDVPMPELKRRIGKIRSLYGPRTNVQVTGGDPTLRKPEELAEVVRTIHAAGMRSALFTNGIKATRALLIRLAEAGLDDVAFHVDMTQERRGYATEANLNRIREDYLARANGLGLRVIFNTTVYDGNFAEVPALARWFRDRAAEIHTASFQIQAETGRGVLGARSDGLTQAGVMAAVAEGIGTDLGWGGLQFGHQDCNQGATVMVAGNRAVAVDRNRWLLNALVPLLTAADWTDAASVRRAVARVVALRPWLAPPVLAALVGIGLRLLPGLISSGGRAHRLGLFVHNFMDAKRLDRARCESCIFMTMTGRGPISMCVHNARRDQHLTADLPVARALPAKLLKGRAKMLAARRPAKAEAEG